MINPYIPDLILLLHCTDTSIIIVANIDTAAMCFSGSKKG